MNKNAFSSTIHNSHTLEATSAHQIAEWINSIYSTRKYYIVVRMHKPYYTQ